MLHAISSARQLTLWSVALLMVSSIWLGAEHLVTRAGWIALMSAVIFNLARSGHRPIATSQLLISMLLGAGIATLCAWRQWDGGLVKLIPACFQGLLAVLVARTLLPGRQPAIERIAAALHPEQQPFAVSALTYMRHSTWLWLLVFSLLAVVHAGTAVLNTTAAPSEFMALGLDLSVIATVLLLEFAYRRWRHAEQSHDNLLRFVLDLRRIDPLNLLLS